MSDDDEEYSAECLLPRIRKELDKLPLTNEQKADIASRIITHLKFLTLKNSGALVETSEFFDFSLKTGAVVERFADDGLTTKDYLQAAFKQPQLFFQASATLIGNICGVVDRFVDDGLTTKDYLRAALKQPQLFTMTPTTLIGNICRVVDRFADDGLTTKDYLRAALKQPQLFYQAPATLIGNICRVVDRFADDGLTTKDYLRAAIKQPSLFCQAPQTVVGNICGLVDRFADDGLTMKDYLRAALKQPSLFTQNAATITRHIGLVFDLYDEGVFTLSRPRNRDEHSDALHNPYTDLLDFLLRNPSILCLEDNNLYLRKLHKEMTDATPSPKNLLRPRRDTEVELMHQLGHDDPTSPVEGGGYIAGRGPPIEKQAKRFVLRALIREGYIKSGKLER